MTTVAIQENTEELRFGNTHENPKITPKIKLF